MEKQDGSRDHWKDYDEFRTYWVNRKLWKNHVKGYYPLHVVGYTFWALGGLCTALCAGWLVMSIPRSDLAVKAVGTLLWFVTTGYVLWSLFSSVVGFVSSNRQPWAAFRADCLSNMDAWEDARKLIAEKGLEAAKQELRPTDQYLRDLFEKHLADADRFKADQEELFKQLPEQEREFFVRIDAEVRASRFYVR